MEERDCNDGVSGVSGLRGDFLWLAATHLPIASCDGAWGQNGSLLLQLLLSRARRVARAFVTRQGDSVYFLPSSLEDARLQSRDSACFIHDVSLRPSKGLGFQQVLREHLGNE